MTEDNAMVEDTESWDDDRLNAEKETLYIQTSDEYDQVFARAQMSVVDEHDISTAVRVCGPSGCGKTTMARSLAIDVKVADTLINDHEIPVWQMTLDELAVFHNIVMNDDGGDGDDVCPECDAGSIYARSTKTPTYRCNNCNHEFEEPKVVNDDSTDWYGEFEDVSSVSAELQERGLVDANDEKTDAYPHSRADAYRDLYVAYEGIDAFPSAPYFEITMSHAKYAKDLIGHPHIGDNGTTFIKGKVTKAVEASNEEATVLTLDEINRAPTSAKDELYDALDGRVKVSMDEVGGVEIEGCPSNLIIVSTMNKGSGHHVEPLDFAEKRRLGSTHYVDFLGREYPDKEIDLITEMTPVPEDLAAEMVSTANELRETAANDETDLSYGVPTGTLLEWADEAYTNHIAGVEEPVVNAGANAVARAIYDHDEDEVSKVEMVVSKNMQGVDFFATEEEDEENGSTSTGINEKRFTCMDETGQGCSWSAYESEAPVEALEFLICPECESELEEREPGR